ncbi:RTA1 domain-containing protein [Aspergillus novofumigatus IBT 16806]|uniref:Putative RTA1 domain protein n=1 Tax=Aspergillus novofumigatus (strain IBT 16806) TaxID=1392255 RepID=A0A2I1C3R0_ASPN1|nr:putative RTA1 domain protein [Aspergillus novofumigatus IBT 16806]PKX92277.1 putative RTA1 domain protein [Aspergillus novofumigatus IBT 16806]
MVDLRDSNGVDFAFYRYDPSMGGAVIFVLLFIGTTAYHIFRIFKTHTWFFFPFVIGASIIGYIGRAMSSRQSPDWTLGPYLVQTLFLLLAPALLAALIYIFLGRIILVLQAESHALLKKKWLTKIFVTGDVLSSLLQGASGGIQSSGNLDSMKNSEHIIIVGLLIQIFFFGFFIMLKRYLIPCSCSPDILWRKHLNILYVTSFLIMIRSIFRLAEYIQGNDGYLLHHEIYLYIFDALLMFITMQEIGQLLARAADYALTRIPDAQATKAYGGTLACEEVVLSSLPFITTVAVLYIF